MEDSLLWEMTSDFPILALSNSILFTCIQDQILKTSLKRKIFRLCLTGSNINMQKKVWTHSS